MANDDDEMPQLSSATLAALNEWVQEQAELKGGEDRDGAVEMVTEDWRMSQFWYDSETAATVAAEIHHLSKQFSSPRVACVACPSVYVKLKNTYPDVAPQLLEFDTRFEKYGDDFTHYDYNDPENVPRALRAAFQIVVADPPYLSLECLEKTWQTIRCLSANSQQPCFLLLTGAVQRERVANLLKARPCAFKPRHQNKLGNDFSLYVSYEPGTRLGGLEATEPSLMAPAAQV